MLAKLGNFRSMLGGRLMKNTQQIRLGVFSMVGAPVRRPAPGHSEAHFLTLVRPLSDPCCTVSDRDFALARGSLGRTRQL